MAVWYYSPLLRNLTMLLMLSWGLGPVFIVKYFCGIIPVKNIVSQCIEVLLLLVELCTLSPFYLADALCCIPAAEHVLHGPVCFLRRAKLYRFASENDPPEWKERGTGDVKLLRHKEKGSIRLLMRRDRTLKICANHNIVPLMDLKPNAGSDRAWVWNTHADFADEHPKPELLAIRFLNAENAQKFKAKFDECKEEVRKTLEGSDSTHAADKVTEKLEELSVKDQSEPAEKQGSGEKKEADTAEEK
uniref:Ran-specific GTPase-activating protein n=1 Tax=Paramormyrops kingsleyae TaxID=1676925 RepID=A0A3B3SD15_9TELE